MRTGGHNSGLRSYLREIGQYPLLSREEEQKLAHDIAERGDHAAKERMVLCNLRLVVDIAKRYAGRGRDLMDLVAEGNLGLLHAVDKFDADRGFRFSTYATWWIKRAIRRAVSSSARTVRIPTHMVETIAHAKQAQTQLRAELKREPTIDQIAERLQLTPARALLLKQALAADTRSMDQSLGTGSLADILRSREEPGPDEVVFDRMQKQALSELLQTIDEREARILSLRFGLDEGGPKTLREVGRIVHLSRERVRQIEHRALEKLKEALNQAGFD